MANTMLRMAVAVAALALIGCDNRKAPEKLYAVTCDVAGGQVTHVVDYLSYTIGKYGTDIYFSSNRVDQNRIVEYSPGTPCRAERI